MEEAHQRQMEVEVEGAAEYRRPLEEGEEEGVVVHQSQLVGEEVVEGEQQDQTAGVEEEQEDQMVVEEGEEKVQMAAVGVDLNWMALEEVEGEQVDWKRLVGEEWAELKPAGAAAVQQLDFSEAVVEGPVKREPHGGSWEGAEAVPPGWLHAAGVEEERPVRDRDSAELAARTPSALPGTGEETRISEGCRPSRSSGAAEAVEARASIRTQPAVVQAEPDPGCGRICRRLRWAEGHGTWGVAERVRELKAPDWERHLRGFSATGEGVEGRLAGCRRCSGG